MARPAHVKASPFPVDADEARRLSGLEAAAGAVVRAALATRHDGSFVPRDEVEVLVRAHGLAGPRDLALLALPVAAALARPWISDYPVGAVGVTPGGDLVLGGNLEFPGASIHHTVHAEGFVTLRARAIGLGLEALAVRQARPCAHCRQVLAEMAWAPGLRVVDPMGADVALWDLYPLPFEPGDLGEAGCVPGLVAWPALVLDDDAGGTGDASGRPPLGAVREALVRAGSRSHAPYSGEPAAAVLETADGRLFAGCVLESVAFNPTIGPAQDALVAVAAAGVPFDAVTAAWLGVARGARVGHEAAVRELLSAVAPRAALSVRYWA